MSVHQDSAISFYTLVLHISLCLTILGICFIPIFYTDTHTRTHTHTPHTHVHTHTHAHLYSPTHTHTHTHKLSSFNSALKMKMSIIKKELDSNARLWCSAHSLANSDEWDTKASHLRGSKMEQWKCWYEVRLMLSPNLNIIVSYRFFIISVIRNSLI